VKVFPGRPLPPAGKVGMAVVFLPWLIILGILIPPLGVILLVLALAALLGLGGGWAAVRKMDRESEKVWASGGLNRDREDRSALESRHETGEWNPWVVADFLQSRVHPAHAADLRRAASVLAAHPPASPADREAANRFVWDSAQPYRYLRGFPGNPWR
jgi:hypothetical protein